MSRGSDFSESGRRYEDSGDDALADVLNGFSLDSRRRRKRRERTDEQRPEQQQPQQPDHDQQQAPEPEEQRAASSVRSYTWTGGRTRSTHELQLETLVSAGETSRPGVPARLEHQSIADLCRDQPRSVAEVGALLSVPVGVTRVLLADMAELGLITVHQTVSESGSAPHMVLMERVLSGLRRL
ncbi:DUF742 domain-containing protein [Saccharopolyspora sp. HNM0983]|uniref:DUF742 domain-containing protein n=1 Tax=Saccharopolyspora montiporae TaxID=2781240 RepID=A0A929FWV5_9PSEU|nr:DUF742 domain-containing protein [Saccharopolyspora sp. HNM0983]MBE9373971.1 DUF742 domain-containing protein [Saccharopolyspora sp. HNM0983]